MLVVLVAFIVSKEAFALRSSPVRPILQRPISRVRRDAALSTNEIRLKKQIKTVWRFTRPHTLIGTIVSIPAVHALASPTFLACFTPTFWYCVLSALIPAMFVNVFITGLNQVHDADIDKINKPQLPIAAGDLSIKDGKILSWTSLALAAISTSVMMPTLPLLTVLIGSALLGAAYSAPPLRLKRWPLPAALCIITVRGALVNICFFFHACLHGFVQGTTARTSLEAYLYPITFFFAIFGFAIALLKDVPDTHGDAQFDVTTASTALGRHTVFSFATNILIVASAINSALFLAAAFYSSSLFFSFTRSMVGLALGFLAFDLQTKAAAVDPANDQAVTQFYMRLWNLFYASYFMLPFVR
uniref:Homogentisate phytyltransferase n=1 Tax=Aureoumbra lagunensis TaxID=44058 RepID=A0A7S3NGP1_9STRA|mmetsp:Transcript_1120/g.1625  ORF Transcript_1120/g.1625 Transcript_1120/m.1625 type:complete len:358 (+) Transcript_1120:54-1127(+)